VVLADTSERLTPEQCETEEECYHCRAACWRNLEVHCWTGESSAIGQSHEEDRNNGPGRKDGSGRNASRVISPRLYTQRWNAELSIPCVSITLVAISNATSGHNLGVVTNCQGFADATCVFPNKLNYMKLSYNPKYYKMTYHIPRSLHKSQLHTPTLNIVHTDLIFNIILKNIDF